MESPKTNTAVAKTSLFSLSESSRPSILTPDEHHQLVPGVHISTLKGSKEALIEIDSQVMTSEVRVDGQVVVEIASVKTNQVINISGKRFVILNPLEAFIVDRATAALRSDEVEAMIRRAQSLASTSNSTSNANSVRAGLADRSKPVQEGKGKKVRLYAMTALALAIIAALVFGPDPEASKDGSAGGEEEATELALDPATAKPEAEKPSEFLSEAPAPAAKPSDAEQSSTESTEPAAQSATSASNAVNAAPANRGSAASTSAAHSANRSLKKPGERAIASSAPDKSDAKKHRAYQAIQEYKLEARFDPASAKRRIKDLMRTLPKNSAILREAESAFNSIQ